MSYPPAEGELDQVSAAEPVTPSEPAVDEPDHVGAQLDALAGMMARQGQALGPEADTATTPPDATPEEPVAQARVEAPSAQTVEPAAAEPQPSESAAPAPAEEDAQEPEPEIDPLTAPLSALTGEAPATATAAAPEPTIDANDSSETAESVEPVSVPAAIDEPIDTDTSAEPHGLDSTDTEAPREPGTAAALVRPAQLLIVATAALNLVLVGLNAVLGTPSGSMTVVVLGVALVNLAVWTGAAVTFLYWVSRAHGYVAATAASRQRHGASMSLIGWFIPIAGFVIGYRVLQDLWTGSDPTTRDQADAPPAKARTIDIWLLGIITAALFGYAMPTALGASPLWGGLAALGLMVAALSLAATMGTITAWQSSESTTTDHDVADQATADANRATDSAPSVTANEPVAPPATPEPVAATAE